MCFRKSQQGDNPWGGQRNQGSLGTRADLKQQFGKEIPSSRITPGKRPEEIHPLL